MTRSTRLDNPVQEAAVNDASDPGAVSCTLIIIPITASRGSSRERSQNQPMIGAMT